MLTIVDVFRTLLGFELFPTVICSLINKKLAQHSVKCNNKHILSKLFSGKTGILLNYYLHLILCENVIQKFSNSNYEDQHDGEENRDSLELLDQPEDHKAQNLDKGEEINSLQWDLLEEGILRLVLFRHKHYENSIKHLNPIQ